MSKTDIEFLESLSKDEESFKKLKKHIEEIEREKDFYQRSLNLLEQAIKHDYDSILITELNYEKPGPKIVYVNEGFCEMTGYSRDEVIGKTPRILQGPKTERKVLDRLKKRLKEGNSFFGQTVNYRKDGSEFINQWDIHPLKNKQGEITHWVSYQQDLNERKRAERVLVDTNIDFDKLDEESKRILIDVDEQGDIIMANKAFRDLIGYDKEELKRFKVWELVPHSLREEFQKKFEKVLADKGGKDCFKLIALHKSREPIQLEIYTKLLHLKDQDIIRGDVRNVSLQKRVMNKLKQQNAEFADAFVRNSDFNYCVSMNKENTLPSVDYLSESFANLTGYLPEHFENHTSWKELIHPEDEAKVLEHFQKVWNGKSHTESYRIKHREKGYISVMDYAKPEFDSETNEILCVKGSVSLNKSRVKQ